MKYFCQNLYNKGLYAVVGEQWLADFSNPFMCGLRAAAAEIGREQHCVEELFRRAVQAAEEFEAGEDPAILEELPVAYGKLEKICLIENGREEALVIKQAIVYRHPRNSGAWIFFENGLWELEILAPKASHIFKS